jgi:hypothetical protein
MRSPLKESTLGVLKPALLALSFSPLRFKSRTLRAPSLWSKKRQALAPRLTISMPMAPDPANPSITTLSCKSNCRMERTASRIRVRVGLVSVPVGVNKVRFFAHPDVTFIPTLSWFSDRSISQMDRLLKTLNNSCILEPGH